MKDQHKKDKVFESEMKYSGKEVKWGKMVRSLRPKRFLVRETPIKLDWVLMDNSKK